MKQLYLLVAICLMSIFASCDKVKQKVSETCTDPNTCFKIDSLSGQLKKRLDGNCIGYGYVICAKEGVVTIGSGGFERLDQDAPKKVFSVFDPMNPASLSKTITAIALMRALNQAGVSVNDSIYKYLPKDWTFGNLTKTITFKELLTHKSGIRNPVYWMDYPAIKNYFASGITQANKNTQQYDNTNYGIMRILIPRLDGQAFSGTDAQLAIDYGKALDEYANNYIFSKLGMQKIESKPFTENQSLCYQFPANGAKGGDFGDFTTNNGQAGFNISVAQYAQVMRTTFYTNTIISQGLAQQMRDSVWGFDYFWVGATPFFGVKYVGKNGNFPGSNNPGEFNGQLMMFDNNVTVVLFVNSQLNYPGGVGQLIVDAFDASRI